MTNATAVKTDATTTTPAHHPVLKTGEHYAGIFLCKDGEADYRLILMEGEAVDVTFKQANDWIAKRNDGASLPTSREQSLLFANLKEHFEPTWHWSGEQHASGSDYAWYQSFLDGFQHCLSKSSRMRARAVRREPI